MISFQSIGIISILIILLSILIERYWIELIPIYKDIYYPILKNQIIEWEISNNNNNNNNERRRSEDNNNNNNDNDNNKPNIILILADDLGFNDISFYGGGFYNGLVKTPFIDSIGKNGISFYQGYAGHGTCAPSRASLMTGRFPTRFGYEFTPINPSGAKVLSTLSNGVRKGIYHPENAIGRNYDLMTFPTDTITLPKVLRKEGYRTIHLGKWHLGTINESRSFNQGFDETLDFSLISLFLPRNHPESVNCKFENDYLDRFLWANVRYAIRKNNGPYFQPNEYMTDYLANEASKAIIANKNSPFFLYLALNAVHTPLQALLKDYNSLSFISDHCSRVYGAMLLAVDRAVGKILETLSNYNLTDNTIIIFTSDNGAPNYILQPNLNKPFRGWKATLFEGGIRVPFLLQWPKKISPGIQSNDIVSHTDIFSTILEILNVDKSNLKLDGINLLQFVNLINNSSNSEILNNSNKEIVDQKESNNDNNDNNNNNINDNIINNLELDIKSNERLLFWKSGHYIAIRYGDWKLQIAGNPNKVWLYNLKYDPIEQYNLVNNTKYEKILNQLINILRVEESNQAEPIWKSVSESPVSIDFTSDHPLKYEDEFVYWPN